MIARDRFRLTLAANSPGPLHDRIDGRFFNLQTIQTINYTSGQLEVLDADARVSSVVSLLSSPIRMIRRSSAYHVHPLLGMRLGKNQ